MRVFALGDLHLAGNSDKPMDVFGANWNGHFQRICEAWNASVRSEDVVLIPGDISWAMRLEDALEDIRAIGELPGKKVLMRGNHDYWWSSLNKLRNSLPKDVYALQNDSFCFEGVALAGTRGWACPGTSGFDQEADLRIYERELIRLELSLKAAKPHERLIGMLHFPPFNERRQPSGFTELFERYGADTVIYGHLHDKACKNAFEGERNGVGYLLVSADHLDFTPRLVYDGETGPI